MELTVNHIKNVCRFGQGSNTCSFLIFSVPTLACAKGTGAESFIIKRRLENTMNAKGNHCDGCMGEVDLKEL